MQEIRENRLTFLVGCHTANSDRRTAKAPTGKAAAATAAVSDDEDDDESIGIEVVHSWSAEEWSVFISRAASVPEQLHF